MILSLFHNCLAALARHRAVILDLYHCRDKPPRDKLRVSEANIILEIVPQPRGARPVIHLKKKIYFSRSEDPQGTQISWWTKKIAVKICFMYLKGPK